LPSKYEALSSNSSNAKIIIIIIIIIVMLVITHLSQQGGHGRVHLWFQLHMWSEASLGKNVRRYPKNKKGLGMWLK
jgi:hypothetical protein